MKRSRLQIFLVTGLLALLAVLAAMQYVWLGQISEAEKERLTRRLQTDTERFEQDFNREIQSAYYNFQTEAGDWQNKDWARFNERYDFWREKTAYQNLIEDFYYIDGDPTAPVLRFDAPTRAFQETNRTDGLEEIRLKAATSKNFQPFDEARFALVMRIYETPETFKRIMIRRDESVAVRSETPPVKIEMPEPKGFLVIMLDESVIKNQILPDLAKKHFPENDFNLAVVAENGTKVFQTQPVSAPEKSVKIFDLSPDNLLFFANRDFLPRAPRPEQTNIIINQSVQSQTLTTIDDLATVRLPEKKSGGTYRFEIKEGENKQTVIQTTDLKQSGAWTLNVQHSAGSLDQFIARTRNRNLGFSFGILGLLGVSIVLVFVSAQRAKTFAQRQVDFVSSVSHEFRTPLAVIYSAGENLADGVAREESHVSRYGNLIKSEGKKLSAMVEQILEFAGAGAGKKKYDFRATDVSEIIESSLGECQTLFDEKGFTVEKDVAENLPPVRADANALRQAMQNLIGNALKYSNGKKYLKITARGGGSRVEIAVEDRGIGIAAKDLKHIFEPFYRAKTVVDEQIHGNGLGLSLVKETVKAHGGKITAESEVGKGSKFTIELPLNEIL